MAYPAVELSMHDRGDGTSASFSQDLSWQLPLGHYIPRDQDMEFVFPRPSDECANWAAHRIAYPGLKYRRRLFIREGSFPHYVDLRGAPEGMVTDAAFGTTAARNPLYKWLEWDVPADASGLHPVALDVLDQEYSRGSNPSAALSATWEINVDASLFIFVDAENGSDETGDGTEEAPFKTINGFYLSDADDNTYAGKAVYFMPGSYDVLNFDSSNPALRMGSSKPLVWLAHPDAEPDSIVLKSHVPIATVSDSSDLYIGDNILIDDTSLQVGFTDARGISILNAPRRVTVMVNYRDLARGTSGNDNPAGLFMASAGCDYFAASGQSLGEYSCAVIDLYGVRKGLIEDFVMSGDSLWHQTLYAKHSNTDLQFRLCRTTKRHENQYGVIEMGSGGNQTGCSVEYCYVEGASGSGADQRGLVMEWAASDYAATPRVNRARRNTVVGSLDGLDRTYTAIIDGNVVVSAKTPPIIESAENRTVESGLIAENAVFSPGDGAVDLSTGQLTGDAREQHLGTAGWEIA